MKNIKPLLLMMSFFILGDAMANSYAKMFNLVFRNELYYASYIFIKKAAEKNQKLDQAKVNLVLDKIHPSVFIHDFELDKFARRSTQIDFAVAMRRFFKNDFRSAKLKLLKIKPNNSMFVESNYILGLIYLTEKENKKAEVFFKRCVRFSSQKEKTGFKSEAYIETFKNRCVQQVARVAFAQKNYTKSVKLLSYVKKTDYIWPRFLLDKAWNYYWLGENERALGSVITYQAPLLQRYMVPEANYLRSLIYYEMCYFDKSEEIFKEFAQNTWRYRNSVRNASRNKLLQMMTSTSPPESKAEQFLYYYLKGFKKDIRHFTYLQAREQLASEIKKLARIRSLGQARVFLNNLYFYYKAIKEDYQDFLKNLSNDYYLQILQMRNAFVKLNLMISLNKRKNLVSSQNENEKQSFEELDFSKIKNTDDKYIWSFLGGFWADELGDYAVAIKNRCVK
ncbi:MAG: hypothetical protein CME62_03060 [Halobacteriovoraceae bacterium]|nr:hypothetical protein [Halobacteriovoraceae bacterium]